jgi:hypothetical protein
MSLGAAAPGEPDTGQRRGRTHEAHKVTAGQPIRVVRLAPRSGV